MMLGSLDYSLFLRKFTTLKHENFQNQEDNLNNQMTEFYYDILRCAGNIETLGRCLVSQYIFLKSLTQVQRKKLNLFGYNYLKSG